MYLHKWVFTSKEYGFDMAQFIRDTIRDCGVALDCPCDTPCEGTALPFATTEIVSELGAEALSNQDQLNKAAIEQLAATNNLLHRQLEELKAELNTLRIELRSRDSE